MNETTVAPRIRFRGFDSGWEEKTFSDLYRLNVRKNDLTYGNEDIISVAKMFYAPNPMVTDEDYLRTYNVIEKGEIAFEGNRSGDYAYGRFVENDIGNGIVSHVFQVFSPIVSMDIDYWKYAINDERIMRPVLANSTKTSTMMMEIVPSRFLNQKVHVPCLEEQEKIGSLLTLVDRLIALYEKVIPIFDIVVESRFIEMFGGCSKDSLLDCAEVIMGQSPPSSSYNDVGEGIPFLQGKSDFGDVFVHPTKYCSAPNKVAAPMDILMSVRAPVGSVNITQEGCCIGRGLAAIRPKSGCDVWFLFYALKMIESEISAMGVGSTFTAICRKDIGMIRIPQAPLDAQLRFSEFLQQVDKSRFDYIKKYEALKMLRESLMCGMLIPVSDEEENKMRS